MNFIYNVFNKRLEENERNVNFWEAYINDLNALDFSLFGDKLTVPVLVPVGNKIFFRGLLKHTNEVTISLGADYFAKCSTKQAEIIKQHRIKDAQSKLDLFKKEKDFIENQLKLNKSTYDSLGQDIIETCTEEEDSLWREKHKERVRQYNQSKEKNIDKCDNVMTDEELWSKLEELELQEELEEEYLGMTNRNSDVDSDYLSIIKDNISPLNETISMSNPSTEMAFKHNKDSESKVHILEKTIARQKNLELKLNELQIKERENCKTEDDLLERLNEMDVLDELEDEINRLDILNEDSEDSETTTEEISTPSSKKTVTFADDDESETLEISFTHSNIKPDTSPYNPTSGIKKPSDIYEAFFTRLRNETLSILKNTKNGNTDLNLENKYAVSVETESSRETIVVKDVLEKVDKNEISNNMPRPISLFKKRRQHHKK